MGRRLRVVHLPENRAELFVFLFGWGVLLHKLAKADFATSWFSALGTAAAFAIVLRPRWTFAVSLVFVSIIGQVLIGFDLFGNHWPFLGLLGLGWFACHWHGYRTGDTSIGAVADRFFPIARWSWIVMWVIVSIHKFNRGFFELPQSCAVQLYEQSRSLLPVLPDLAEWAPSTLPPSVALAEAAIAVALIVPRFRAAAVAMGLVFHLLSGAAVPSFGGVAMAFYVPFIAPSVVDSGVQWVRRFGRRFPITSHGPTLVVAGMGALTFANGWANLTGGDPPNEVRTAGLAVVASGVGLLFLYGVALREHGRRAGMASESTLGRPVPVGMAILAVAVIIGISPYLGARTENSLSMFSNLRTEAELWNHYFVPDWIKVFESQDDLVTILDTGVTNVARVADRLELPLAEVRFVDADLARRIRLHCDDEGPAAMTVWRDQAWVEVADACVDPALTQPDGVVWDRIMLFRAVPETNQCQH